MALTMEDILLARQQKKRDVGPEFTPPYQSERDDADLAYIRNLNETYTPPAPIQGPVEPTLIDRAKEFLTSPPSETPGFPVNIPTLPTPETIYPESAPVTTSPQTPEMLQRMGKSIVGAGESALALGTSMVGGGVGALSFAEQAIRDIGEPSTPNYWKNLVTQSNKVAQEFTYQPRTEEGKAAVGSIAPVFDALHWFSRRASEAPLARMLLTDDQREALAYAHELVTMTVAGELGSKALGALGRTRVRDFQETFTEAAKESSGATPEAPATGPSIDRLNSTARNIVEQAQKSPEIMERFSPERVSELRAKQQEQGYAELDAGLERMREIKNFEQGIEGAAPAPTAPVEQVSPNPAIRPSRKSREIARQPTEEVITPTEEITPPVEQVNPYSVTTRGRGDHVVSREGAPDVEFSNRRTAERFAKNEWLNEQAKAPDAPQVLKDTATTETTLEDVSRSPSRRTPSARSAEEKIQAIEQSNAFANRESTIRRIQDSLESGENISREIMQNVPGSVQSEFAVIRYNQLRAIARNGINSSNRRGVMDIIQDITELFAFDVDPTSLGMFGNVALSHRQKMAAQRLSADAAKAGQSLQDLMAQRGIDPVTKVLFDDYLTNQMGTISPPSGVGPKNMRLDGKSMTTDPVMERNIKSSGKLGPPLYENEMRGFQTANVREAPGRWAWETPINTMKSFGTPIYDMTVVPLREAKKAFKVNVEEMRGDLRRLEKVVKYADRREITQAVEAGNPASLKGAQRQVHGVLESGVENYLARAEETRNAIGVEPLPDIVDPIEAMRAIVTARSHGVHVNLATSSADAIRSAIDTYSVEPMKPSLTQRAFRLSSETDIFRQYDRFATAAEEQLSVAPLTSKLRELANGSHLDVVNMDGSYVSLQESNPGLKKTINDWTHFVDGMPSEPLMAFGKNWDPILRKFGENLAWSMLSGNLRSVMSQPFSLISTMHKSGIGNTLAAVGDSLGAVLRNGNARTEAIGSSKVLSTRKDPALYGSIVGDISEGVLKDIFRTGKEATIALREGRSRDVIGALSQIGMTGLEWADYESAIITWNAFKRQGTKLGLRGEDLVNFADDGLVTTQASGARGDLSPIQRSALGRTLTQFQTFTLTDWNYMMNEIIKPARNAPIKDTIANVGRFVGIVTAFNTIAGLVGFDPPTPQPVKEAMKSMERGDDPLTTAFKVAFETVAPYTPVFGGSRYGKGVGGPLMGTAFVDLPQSMLGRPGAQPLSEPVSKLLGVPGISSWWKTGKGDPNRTIYERLLNYVPEAQGGGPLGSGLSSGLGGRMGSGLK